MAGRPLRRRGRSLRDAAASAADPRTSTADLAELVCSNSLRGAALENAVGLLKEELARLGSLIVTSARECAVPAGGALAVDRRQFARRVEARIAAEPRIRAAPRGGRRDSARPRGDRRLRTAAAAGVPRAPRHAARRGSPRGSAARGCTTSTRRRRSSPPTRSTRRRCTASRATTRATATTISTSRSIATATRSCVARSADPRTPRREGLRGDALFRGMPADRRDGRPRRRHAALRAAQAGRVTRSAHGQGAARRGAAAQGEPRGHRLQPRRFSDAARVAGAKRGVRKAPGPGAGGMAAPRRHASQHVHRFAAAARRAAQAARNGRRSTSPGQITGAEGYVEAAACGAMAGIHAARASCWDCRRSSFRARARSAPWSRTCRTATRPTSSRRT